MRKRNKTENEQLNTQEDIGKALHKDKEIQKMERRARFWNRHDWVNKFRHWYFGVRSFTSGIFRVVTARQTITILLVILIVLYIMAAFYTGKGEFVVQVEQPMANEGFILSETPDFKDWKIILRNDAVEDATNINICEIDENVMNIDGKHNGKDYVAYTFYLKNRTKKEHDYEYTISIKNKDKGVDKATWLMVYHNDEQIIYAAPSKAGHEECQYSRWKFPFVDDAKDQEYQLSTITNENPGYITQKTIDYHQISDLNGIYQLRTVPFESEQIVCKKLRKDIKKNEVDKFTVVIWLEGEDPECVNDIIGGYVEFGMRFSLAGK